MEEGKRIEYEEGFVYGSLFCFPFCDLHCESFGMR